jgi:hypothetical protein
MVKRKRLLTNVSRRGISKMANLGTARLAELDQESCEQLFSPDDPTGEHGCSCEVCSETEELQAALKWLQVKLSKKQ